MRLPILLRDGFTAQDIVGGYEVLAKLPGMDVEFVAPAAGLVWADTRRLALHASATWTVGILAGEDVAKTVQLCIEYDPDPPFDNGSPNHESALAQTFVRQFEAEGTTRLKAFEARISQLSH